MSDINKIQPIKESIYLCDKVLIKKCMDENVMFYDTLEKAGKFTKTLIYLILTSLNRDAADIIEPLEIIIDYDNIDPISYELRDSGVLIKVSRMRDLQTEFKKNNGSSCRPNIGILRFSNNIDRFFCY